MQNPQFPHVPLPAWLLRSLSSWYSDIVQSAAARLLEGLAGIDGALLYLLVSPVVPAIFLDLVVGRVDFESTRVGGFVSVDTYIGELLG